MTSCCRPAPRGFAAGLRLLFWDHDGHIMPGGMAVAWVTERLSPLGFGLPILEMIAFQALAMWLVWKAPSR